MSLALATLLALTPTAPGPTPVGPAGSRSQASTRATATATASLPSCSWNRPGQNPFMGDVVAAVDRYSDIPAPVRARLKARMASRSYDEIVSIRRDAIVGQAPSQARYGAEIRDMHFGTGQVCGSVNRLQWAASTQELGLVYCEAGECILVPTVCRNVSRITRSRPAVATAADAQAAGGGGGGAAGGNAGPGLLNSAAAPAPAVDAGGTAPGGGSFAALAGLSGPLASGGNNAAAPGAGGAVAADGPSAADDYFSGREIAALPVGGPSLAPDPGGFVPSGGLPGGGIGLPIISAVPEPGAGLMLLGGLAWLLRRSRPQRRVNRA